MAAIIHFSAKTRKMANW